MPETETSPAASGPAAIRCSECNQLVPADRMRHREERVKVAPPPARWGANGRPMFPQNVGRTGASPQRRTPGIKVIKHAYQIDRIPVCVDCLRRQRLALFGVCGVAVACVLAALFVYKRDLSPSQGPEVAETPPSAVAAPVPAAATAARAETAQNRTASSGPASLASSAADPRTPPANSVLSPARSVAPPPSSSPQAPAAASAPSLAAAIPVAPPQPPGEAARSDADAPTRDTDNGEAVVAPVVATGRPVWRPERRAAGRQPLGLRHPPPSNVLDLRNDGYEHLVQRRYPEAIMLLQQASSMGDAYAPMYMGQMFEHGLGVARDVGQASYWYGIAINRGNAAALAAFNHLRMNPY